MADKFVTSTISNATFEDGSTLSGSWTAEYNSNGLLVAVSNANFVVSGSGGTTTFTSMGTLPYAASPSDSSYEIHSLSSSGGGYSYLYVDWRTENPSSLYEGTPSLYTSVLNSAASNPNTPQQLATEGTTGTGSVPGITGLASTESSSNATPRCRSATSSSPMPAVPAPPSAWTRTGSRPMPAAHSAAPD